MRYLIVLILLLITAPPALAARTLQANERWSGKMTLTESVTVPAGVTLEILPGTVLTFAADAGLAVEGRLLAQGTAKQPILFGIESAAANSWPGITLQNSLEENLLQQVRITGATQGLTVVGSRLKLVDSSLTRGTLGISLSVEADAVVERVQLSEFSTGAIDANVKARATVRDCRIKKIAGFGIQGAKQAVVSVTGNRISETRFGILLNGDFPPLANNVIEGGEVGIGLVQAGAGSVVLNNQVRNAKLGIGCRQFCSPRLEQNLVEGCEVGLECYQGSSPQLLRNRIIGNDRGLSCVQMSNPVVQANDFTGNHSAVYLHLSAYARLVDNNFENNQLAVDLDNMSYDWEQRAGHKPKRNRQNQNARLVEQGRAMPEQIDVKVDSVGYVDATGNYWGEQTTREMESKGMSANISTINDGYDTPVLTYEGWEGEYKKDKVRYDGWLSQPYQPATKPESK